MDEKSILNSARGIADNQARDEYLRLACGDDIETLKRIRELLAEHNDYTDFLESLPFTASLTQSTSESAEPIESEIGPYKLLQEIGEKGWEPSIWPAGVAHPALGHAGPIENSDAFFLQISYSFA
jgi:hypothetical protein